MLGKTELDEVLSLSILLDDIDPESVRYVNTRFAELGEEAVRYLGKIVEKESGQSGNKLYARRYREIEDEFLLHELKKRSAAGFPDLPDALYLISRTGLRSLDRRYFMELFVQTAFETVMDISSKRTAVENIEIFNYHFFKNYSLLPESCRQTPDNSVWLPGVMEKRMASPVLLSVLYMMLARNAGLPVYPAVIGKGKFVPAYASDDGKCLFVMDVKNSGMIFPATGGNNVVVLNRNSAVAGLYAENIYVRYCMENDSRMKGLLKKIMSLCDSKPLLGSGYL